MSNFAHVKFGSDLNFNFPEFSSGSSCLLEYVNVRLAIDGPSRYASTYRA